MRYMNAFTSTYILIEYVMYVATHIYSYKNLINKVIQKILFSQL